MGTPSASSIAVASTSRTPPFSVSRPSPTRDQGVLAGSLGAEVEQPAGPAPRAAGRTGSRGRRRARDCRRGTGGRDSACASGCGWLPGSGSNRAKWAIHSASVRVSSPTRRRGAVVAKAQDRLRESPPPAPDRRTPGPAAEPRVGPIGAGRRACAAQMRRRRGAAARPSACSACAAGRVLTQGHGRRPTLDYPEDRIRRRPDRWPPAAVAALGARQLALGGRSISRPASAAHPRPGRRLHRDAEPRRLGQALG